MTSSSSIHQKQPQHLSSPQQRERWCYHQILTQDLDHMNHLLTWIKQSQRNNLDFSKPIKNLKTPSGTSLSISMPLWACSGFAIIVNLVTVTIINGKQGCVHNWPNNKRKRDSLKIYTLCRRISKIICSKPIFSMEFSTYSTGTVIDLYWEIFEMWVAKTSSKTTTVHRRVGWYGWVVLISLVTSI